jgi:hypothetical protein
MFGQVIAAIFYVYYVVVRFCVPTFADLNQNQITLPIFTSVLFNSIMPGSLFLLLGRENRVELRFFKGFYGFLHCWLNAFAEMLRFADRMFYQVKILITKNCKTKMFYDRIGGIPPHSQLIIEHGMLSYMTGFIHMSIKKFLW